MSASTIERKTMPGISRNGCPCIINRALKDLAAIGNNILNDVHVKPYTFCLGTHNSSRTKGLCYRPKEGLLKQFLCGTWDRKRKDLLTIWLFKECYIYSRTISTNWIRRIYYDCIISTLGNSFQKCNS